MYVWGYTSRHVASDHPPFSRPNTLPWQRYLVHLLENILVEARNLDHDDDEWRNELGAGEVFVPINEHRYLFAFESRKRLFSVTKEKNDGFYGGAKDRRLRWLAACERVWLGRPRRRTHIFSLSSADGRTSIVRRGTLWVSCVILGIQSSASILWFLSGEEMGLLVRMASKQYSCFRLAFDWG